MKVDSIKINGFKKLVQFSIDPDGKSVEISGRNGNGKSSIIDAIWVTLTGKDVPGIPINKECVKAKIIVGLDSGHTATLEFKARGGKTLTVEGPDGMPVKAPQAFLNDLIGRISFDPFDFVNKTPKQQKEFLQDLLKIDNSDLDVQKNAALTEKREAEADRNAIERQLEELAGITETVPVDVSKLMAAQESRQKVSQDLDKARHTLESVRVMISTSEDREKRISDEIERTREQLQRQVEELAAANAETETAKDRLNRGTEVVKSLEKALESVPDHSQDIRDASEINRKAESWKRKQALRAELDIVEKSVDASKQTLEDIENDRKERLFAAKFPVPGMEFTEDGVLFNGLPFDSGNQCQSDILRVGVAIAVAQDPALKIVRIKDGSLLDSASKRELLGQLAEFGFQAFIETVADSELQALTIDETPAKLPA